MLIIRGVIGGILLFLGHQLNFLFAGAMASLLGFRLLPLLPPQWPSWADYAFIIGLGIMAAVAVLLNERVGYFISGFLAGGFLLVEYYAPNAQTVPWLPFVINLLVDWGDCFAPTGLAVRPMGIRATKYPIITNGAGRIGRK